MNVKFCLSANTGASIFKSCLENITYEFVLTSPTESNIFYSSYSWMACEMGGKWPSTAFLKGAAYKICSEQHIASLCSSCLAFSKHFVKVRVVKWYSSTNTATTRKNSHFILSERSNFHWVDNLFTEVHTLPMRILISLSLGAAEVCKHLSENTSA